jgi:hypothetical protein
MDDRTWWLALERDGERQVIWFRGVEQVETERG